MRQGTAKRLVIFGCGYVGTAVALHALARGLRVTALTRNPANALALRAQGIETVVADLGTDAWHDQIAGTPEFVLNSVSSGGGGPEGYRRSYVEGMASIVAWARARGPAGTLVYTSSTSVYPQDGGVEVAETAPTPLATATERAQLLLAAEQQIPRAGAALASRWFVLRLAGIYGPGRHHFVDQVRAGEATGKSNHHLNLIHRDDIVSAIWTCGTAPLAIANEVFNVVDDGPTPKREVMAWLAERLGVPPPRFTGKPVSARRGLTPDRIILNAKLKARLGWQPQYSTFREGCANFLSR